MGGVPRRAPLALIILLLAACEGGGADPTDPRDRGPRGRLAGLVTIGPNCPPPANCPTTPSDYARRKVLVYDENRSQLLFTVDIDSTGLYFIDLFPGLYTVDLQRFGNDTTADVPRVVEITARGVTPLDIRIDTGIR